MVNSAIDNTISQVAAASMSSSSSPSSISSSSSHTRISNRSSSLSLSTSSSSNHAPQSESKVTESTESKGSEISDDESDDESNCDLYGEMEDDYRVLFENATIKHVACRLPKMVDVDPDAFEVIDAKDGFIGTTGLATCVAACARGNTPHGDVKLGVSHVTIARTAAYSLQALTKKMMAAGCDLKSIEIYLVGGQLPDLDDSETYCGSYAEEMEFLAEVDNFPIKGVRLHCSKGADFEAVDVFMNKDYVYYTKSIQESSSESAEETTSNL